MQIADTYWPIHAIFALLMHDFLKRALCAFIPHSVAQGGLFYVLHDTVIAASGSDRSLRMRFDAPFYSPFLHTAMAASAVGLTVCFFGFRVLDHTAVAQESRSGWRLEPSQVWSQRNKHRLPLYLCITRHDSRCWLLSSAKSAWETLELRIQAGEWVRRNWS